MVIQRSSSSVKDRQSSHTHSWQEDDPVGKKVEEEWFPNEGFKPCTRKVRIKHIEVEKDTAKHTGAELKSFTILDSLYERKRLALEHQKKFEDKIPKRALRKRDQDITLQSTLASRLSKDKKTVEDLCTGVTASKLGAKPPYILLDRLHYYGLIDAFKQEDKNITTISKRNKKSQELEQAKKQAEKNKKEKNYKKYLNMVHKLEDEIMDLTGKGNTFFKITKKGEKARSEILRVEFEDPMSYFLDLLSGK